MDNGLYEERNRVTNFSVTQGLAFSVDKGGGAGIRRSEVEFPAGAAIFP